MIYRYKIRAAAALPPGTLQVNIMIYKIKFWKAPGWIPMAGTGGGVKFQKCDPTGPLGALSG